MGASIGSGIAGFNGDKGSPQQARLREPRSVAVGPDGTMYVADSRNFRVRKVSPVMPGFSLADFLVPSADGSELYHFDARGLHLRTLDALTGTARLLFGYDAAGRLESITDQFGNITAFEYEAGGAPSAIVAPYGQRTELDVDVQGRLSRIADPESDDVEMTYHGADGLLATFTDPRGNVSSFGYDTLGLLTSDLAADGHGVTLVRSSTTSGYRVTATSSEGRVDKYETSWDGGGTLRHIRTEPSGARTVTQVTQGGTTTVTYPDGTVAVGTQGPDPRWGMQVPIVASSTVTVPSGTVVTASLQRTAVLSNPANPLALTSLTDTRTVAGRTTRPCTRRRRARSTRRRPRDGTAS